MITAPEQTEETNLQVTIANTGVASVTVNLQPGATVADALSTAGFDVGDRDLFCEGVAAKPEYEVENGDTITMIASKMDAGLR